MSPVPVFRVTVEPLEETCLIRASGELDRSTADRLSSALDAARADGVTTLLDLSAVSFIDTAGLRVLLCSAERLRRARPDVVHRRGIQRGVAARRVDRHQIAAAAGGAA